MTAAPELDPGSLAPSGEVPPGDPASPGSRGELGLGRSARLAARFQGRSRSLTETLADWRELAEPVLRPVRAVLECVSSLGWLTLATGLSCWVIASTLGWGEFGYAAAFLLLLLALSTVLIVGRTSLEVSTRIEPQRVVAGDSAAVEVTARNVGKGPLLPVPLDLPAAGVTARFALPALAAGALFQDVVVLPSHRRGVYTVGPARTRRGDPFGLIRREVTWTEPVEFFVHPRTVPIDSLGSGLLKDLEGSATNDMSLSDLAFHTLREYASGDDRRHIHWLSSARRSEAAGSEQFMVRQFLDTRRSHVAVVVDCFAESWVEEEEFETALSAGASVVVRALRDGQEVSEASGPLVLTRPQRHTALDLFSRAQLGEEPLESVVSRLSSVAPNISAAVLFAGPLTPMLSLRRTTNLFGPDVNVVVVRVEHGATLSRRRSSGRTVVTIGRLADLPRALSGTVTA